MDLNTDKMIAEVDGHIGWMIFNNPKKRNAISIEMWEAVEKILTVFEEDDNIRLIVMKGAGDKAFVSGADISQFEKSRSDASAAQEYEKISSTARDKLANLRKPLIAMIQGYCLGGGMGIALQADIRIASETADFGVTEVRWNQGAGWVHHLTKVIGLGNALELVLWGDERISAKRAKDWGLVNEVVSPDDLMPRAMEWAERMLNLAPRSVRNLKEILYRGTVMGPIEAQRYASNLERNLQGMEDSVEGPKAFSEKRIPIFKNQ